ILHFHVTGVQTFALPISNRVLHGDTVDVETGALLMLTYPDGVFATIDASWSRPDSYPTWGGLTVELVGEHGTVGVDAFGQHLTENGRASCREGITHSVRR